jgi:hypothetical protein
MTMKHDSPEKHGFAGAGGASDSSGKSRCPHCGMMTILQTKRRYDGFTLLEEYLACGFCGARIEAAEDSTSKQPATSTGNARKQSALSVYLFGSDARSTSDGSDAGDSDSALPPSSRCKTRLSDAGLDAASGGGHFCRDCRYYVKHPFLSRCARHDREVEPMQDCPDFSRPDKPSKKAKQPPLTD